MNSNSQIKRGALMSYVAIIFNIIAGLLYTPWMVKQIGKSDYGLYILVTSFLTYFVMDFGLGQTIARFLAKYRAEKQEHKVNQLLGITTRLYLYINLILLVVLIVIFFLIEYVFKELNPIELVKFKTIYCIAGLFSLISFPFMPLNGILIAYERFILLKFCDFISKVGLIVAMVIALYFGYKLYALVAINAIMGIIIILIKLFYINRTTNVRVDFYYKSRDLSKQLLGFSVWVTVIGIAQRLMLNIAPTLLAIYSGTIAIAVFSIGNFIEGYVWTFASALNGLFLPKVAKIVSSSTNRDEVTKLMIRVGRMQLFIIGVLFVGIITLGKEFIVLWMGPDFVSSYPIVLLLILPGLIPLTQEIAISLMYVENEVKFKAILYISSSIVSIVISLFLIPKLGALGAAIGIFIALMIFQVIGMNIVYYKKMKLDMGYFFKECYGKMLLPLGLSLGFGFFISNWFLASSFVLFTSKVLMISLFYFMSMWFLGLNVNEKGLIITLISKVRLLISNNK
ncbi:lipopolysaccharide biosynthesis protein [Pedobacter sp. Hv1]|uniref:lipopolysaccharide biosynthesis protein n=1 Tax=Pedobacter sp. Hv1 TaxID=1740090 RepID=UPI0006D8D3F0|nr:oligosaccharide flippase family protein [Pedobacter sp. Hv1]KQB99629.1 hypothetical protein AQF98_18945 [Pedobacter sp. Hv1]